MSETQTQVFDVELVEQELIEVQLSSIDLIPRKSNLNELEDITLTTPQNGDILFYDGEYWINKPLEEIESEIPNFIYNESPTKINSKRFQVANAFRIGTLRVIFNGLKEKNITIINSTTFELPIDSIISDTIETSYIKQV